jgi:hypothetical protein
MLPIADVGPVGWTLVVWFACAVLIFVLDRLTAAGNGGIWESDDPVVSVLAYLILILAGPFIVVGFLLWIAWDSASRLRRKPCVATVAEERPESEESVLVDLVRRRAELDPRLAGVEVDRWPMCQFWPTPEAMILDLVTKCHQLRRAGASDDLIWQKLQHYRADHGTAELPPICSLCAFIEHRLAIEDQEYLGLGSEFLEEQIARCEQFALATLEHEGKCSGWPPAEWLTERITLDWITVARPRPAVPESRAQAILQLRAYKSRQEIKTLEALMLPGDEVWKFSSPPQSWQQLMGRAGVALVREGRSIAHVITSMN